MTVGCFTRYSEERERHGRILKISTSQAPLLIPVYHLLVPQSLHFLIPALLDFLVAWALAGIASAYSRKSLPWPIPPKQDLASLSKQTQDQDHDEDKNSEVDSQKVHQAEFLASTESGSQADNDSQQLLLRRRKQATVENNSSTLDDQDVLESPASSSPSKSKSTAKSSSIIWDLKDVDFDKRDRETRPPMDTVSPELVAFLYLANPLTIISCLSGSTQLWSSASLFGAIYYSCLGWGIQNQSLLVALIHSLILYSTLSIPR